MHALTTRRPEPYVWVSWITKLLAGESTCLWSAWLRAHYQTAKAPSDFDMGTWQMDHSALLRKTAAEQQKDGSEVYTEGQNLFMLKGKTGTLSGKPDVVAVKEKCGLIVDTKTGSPKASDRIQVMIYMWALPKANPAFAGVTFDGMVVYKTGYNIIMADEIDEIFVKRVAELMKEVCGEAEPHKAPSFGECKYCPVAPEDCAERVKAEKVHLGETDEF
jgi:CRISPR/Cas system-associated exonuclease Cas4 (RecB family)